MPALPGATGERIAASPTTIEVSEGRAVQVHIGPVPSETFERFSPAGR